MTPQELDILNMNYDDFVREYEAICLRTGFYLDVSAVIKVRIYHIKANVYDFESQISSFKGDLDDRL